MTDSERRWDTWPNLIAPVGLFAAPAVMVFMGLSRQQHTDWKIVAFLCIFLLACGAVFGGLAIAMIRYTYSDVAFDQRSIECVNAYTHWRLDRPLEEVTRIESSPIRAKGFRLGMVYSISFQHGPRISVRDGRSSTSACEFATALALFLKTRINPDDEESRIATAMRRRQVWALMPIVIMSPVMLWIGRSNPRFWVPVAVILVILVVSMFAQPGSSPDGRQILYER